jgi:hypothetical protein
MHGGMLRRVPPIDSRNLTAFNMSSSVSENHSPCIRFDENISCRAVSAIGESGVEKTSVAITGHGLSTRALVTLFTIFPLIPIFVNPAQDKK